MASLASRSTATRPQVRQIVQARCTFGVVALRSIRALYRYIGPHALQIGTAWVGTEGGSKLELLTL